MVMVAPGEDPGGARAATTGAGGAGGAGVPDGAGGPASAGRPAGAGSPVGSAARATLRVTVLAGGPGAERQVSLASGQAVAQALRRRGHEVLLADIGPDDLSALDRPADVIFPALHGTFGEDGRVQRLMAQRGLRFVGCGAQASEIAIDKVRTKRIALAAGVPTPAFCVQARTGAARHDSDEPPGRAGPPSPGAPLSLPGAASSMAPPCVVKPLREGSSVGVRIARSVAEREAAVAALLEQQGEALVEQFIAGDELTVGILAGAALPAICIRPAQGFYDYEAKYEADTTQYVFDSHPPEVLARLGELSLRVFAAIGGRHLARVDWIVAGTEPWFLEVNTMPGFTSHSLLPKAAARAGIAFEELTDRLVRMALED